MKVELLHVRDPDNACWTRVFVDGVELDYTQVSEENVDAGAGWEVSEWRERIQECEAEPPSPIRDATLEVLHNPPGRGHIDGWDAD